VKAPILPLFIHDAGGSEEQPEQYRQIPGCRLSNLSVA